MATALTGIRACVFDAYGTVFDYALGGRGLPRCARRPSRALTALWRDKQLQYT